MKQTKKSIYGYHTFSPDLPPHRSPWGEEKKLHFQQPTFKHFSVGGQKINPWIPKELLKVLQNSKQNPNHHNSMRATGTLFCVFPSLTPPCPTKLPWGNTWSSEEEQEPPESQVQQEHPALAVGAKPEVEQTQGWNQPTLHRAGSSTFHSKRNWCSLQAPHILLPLEHTSALLPCHFYLSNLSL